MTFKTAFKKLICLLTVLATVLSVLPAVSPAQAAESRALARTTFSDVTANAEAIELMALLGLIDGYPDGTYRPSLLIKRSEAASLVSRAFWGGIDDRDLYLDGNPGGFSDIENHWARGFINYCAVLGLFSGDGSGLMRPDDTIRTVEFYKLALSALGYSPAIEGYVGSSWSRNILEDAKALGLTAGVRSADFSPVTRADAAQIMYNLLYANTVVYDHGKPIPVMLGGEPVTFGMEYLDFRSVRGVLYANGYALLSGAPVAYTHASFSPAPNGITTYGGLVRTERGEWITLDRISPPLELVGRTVIVNLAGGTTLSVQDAGTSTSLAAAKWLELYGDSADESSDEADGLLPDDCAVYVNYSPADESALEDALSSGENTVFVSNDADTDPEYVFIERTEYAGKLLSTSVLSYPGYGKAYTFSEVGERFSDYVIGGITPGMYANIRQIGLYSFITNSSNPILNPQTPAPTLALVTGAYCRIEGETEHSAGSVAVRLNVLHEDGTTELIDAAAVSLNGSVYTVETLAAAMSEAELAAEVTGAQIYELTDYVAADLRALVSLAADEDGRYTVSPTLDGTGAEYSADALTVYSDYAAGSAVFGIGSDSTSRYVADDTVLFLETDDGWRTWRGADIPALNKRAGIRMVDAAYANMFSLSANDGLRLRAIIADGEDITLDMTRELEFYMPVSEPEKQENGRYTFDLFDGESVREVTSAAAPKQFEIYHSASEKGGLVTLSNPEYASGERVRGVLTSCYNSVMSIRTYAEDVIFTAAEYTAVFVIDGEDSRAADMNELRDLLGRDAAVIGKPGAHATLVFVFD